VILSTSNSKTGIQKIMETSSSQFILSNEPHASDVVEFPRVIRRDIPGDTSGKPRVVPWLGHKTAHAVAAACVAQGEDEIIGRQVQAEIEFRMRRERPLFIHIEQIQDLVEETLLELDYGKVALAYAKYRAKRGVEREHGALATADSGEQLELATPGQLADIRARISFARIGLQQLTLSDNELTARLLRSVSLNLTIEDRRDTIILNAKSLLDLDADARFFAARILLSYIYEETLPWKVANGPQALKEAHRRALVDYIPRGIALGRLDPQLAKFDLRKLANALDPFADLQFDFIGIQTLYDRYLIHTHEAITSKRQRLEAPQIFWMRVAMGLALLESEKETRAIEFYGVYKRGAPAVHRPRFSTPARSIHNFPHAICSIAATASRKSRKRGDDFRISPNGRAASAVRGLGFAAMGRIFTVRMVKARAWFRF
jgi:ribonucleoside-diphosphate reductase alpha chain